MSEKLKQRVAAEIQHRDQFTVRDFTTSPGSNGKRTSVAEFQTNRPLAIRNGFPVDLAIMAYEEQTADGTAGDQETFTLSHNPIQSGATSDNLVVYEGDTELAVDSVDFDADTVTVTPANAGSTIGFFYASGDQARVEIHKEAPNGTHEPLWSGDLKLLHMRDHEKDPVSFNFTQSYWQSILPTDWTLKVYVNAPYIARFGKDVGGDGAEERATNALLGIPFAGGTGEIEGLSQTVRLDAANR